MTSWLLVALVVAATVVADLLQSFEMKRHGEIHSFHPRGFGKLLYALAGRKYLILAVFFLAISFFAFMTLVSVADLSFAVPATATSIALETVLAKLILKEQIGARRWAGAFLVVCGVALLAW